MNKPNTLNLSNLTVEQLRKWGFKVRVNHSRYPMSNPGVLFTIFEFNQMKARGEKIEFTTKGGQTILEVTTPDGAQYHGEAKCSTQDNFCYKAGVALALSRLIKVGGYPTVNTPLDKQNFPA